MAILKYKDPTTGDWIELSNAVGDTLPIGAIVEYDGTTVPTNWEKVNDYSTEEVKTGKTWIDGKPIYRKVIPGLTKNGNIEHNISNLDYVINIKGICKKTNGNFEPIPRLTTGTVSQYGIGIGDISSTSIYFEKGSSVSISESYIIIEYTKTTD